MKITSATPQRLPEARPARLQEEARDTLSRREIPDSFIVMAPNSGVAPFFEDPKLKVQKVLGKSSDSTFLLVQGEPDRGAANVYPNYEYTGQLFDEPVQSDTRAEIPARPVHLDIINIEPAWAVTKGSPNVTTAVTDTGADLSHPLIQPSVWHNPGEIAGNGIDDDNNGKIDDVVGWDFSDHDNDPSDVKSYHHTHVHGIAHAQAAEGVAGIAPGAKGMALRVAGGHSQFSSAVLVESYLYALNEGAKSINTSFNIDGFVGDKAIEQTYRNLADNDVLLFNSAGNEHKRNSPRSAFDDIVLVASTDTSAADRDKRSEFSNYGYGVDISAPGKDIVSTMPGNRIAPLSGTSMASPVAMAVDVLVQSAHPDWTRAQRWAQIAGTADKIDAVNPENVDEMGHGRVNAGRALTEELKAPTLTVKDETFPNGQCMNLKVRFDSVFDPVAANAPEAFRVTNEKGEVVMQGPPKEIRLLTNEVDFNVSKLPAGSYTFTASASHLHDPFGRPLDGNKDGTGGDDVVVNFKRV